MNGLFILVNIYWFVGFTICIFIEIMNLYIKVRYKKNLKAFKKVFCVGGLLMSMSWIQCSIFEINFKNIMLSFVAKNIYFSLFICTVLAVLLAVWLEKMPSSKVFFLDDTEKEDNAYLYEVSDSINKKIGANVDRCPEIAFDKEKYLKHLSEDIFIVKYKERSTGKIYEVNPKIDNSFYDTIYRNAFRSGEYILVSGELPNKWK